jgi:putative hydroxymethylpyrimidine transport system substrate-binding protein
MSRRLCSLAGVTVLLAGLAGCGGGGDADHSTARVPPAPKKEFEVTLDGEPGPQNVGILMAEQRGYFDDAGLHVSVYPPETLRRPIPYVLRRWVDISVSHEPQVELAQEQGFPIVAVASLISEPTAAMIWLRRSGVSGIRDLQGETIAIPGLSFQRDHLRRVLRRVDLSLADVEVEVVGHDLVPALISGRAAAIFGGSGNVEGAELEAQGLQPVVVPVRKLGIPSYDELVFIARTDRLAEDPESIDDFLSAVGRGTEAAIDDPQAAVEAIDGFYVGANAKVSKGAVEATLPLLSRARAAAP